MEESSLSLSEEDLDDLTQVLFEAADEDDSGSITFEELKAELEKHPGVIENLTIRLGHVALDQTTFLLYKLLHYIDWFILWWLRRIINTCISVILDALVKGGSSAGAPGTPPPLWNFFKGVFLKISTP